MKDNEIIWSWDRKQDVKHRLKSTKLIIYIISTFSAVILILVAINNFAFGNIFPAMLIFFILFFAVLKIAMDKYDEKQVLSSSVFRSIKITKDAIIHNLTGKEEVITPNGMDISTLSADAYPLYKNIRLTFYKDGNLESQELYGFPIHRFEEFKSALEEFKSANKANQL